MISSSSSPLIPVIILLILCLPTLFYLAPHILPPPPPPPISFPAELEDLSLFRRATDIESHPNNKPKSRLGSTNSKPKIAFLFLTNSDLHFSPLWELYFSQSNRDLYTIYVHADPTVNPKVNIPNGVFTKDRFLTTAKKTRRGTATLISAERRLLATAILDDPANAFFTLISQHCIPIRSFKYFYDTLFQLKSHQVAELRTLKYKSFIEIVANDPNIWDRYNARGKNVMVPEVSFDKFRMGSQFFTLTRKHAVTVVGDRLLWKKFKLDCLRPQSCYPEEHYFPTLLSMVDPKGCGGYTLTRVNWTESVNGHPHTYYPTEVSAELIYELRRSNFTNQYMFARKFSPDCLEPLMQMAKEVILRD